MYVINLDDYIGEFDIQVMSYTEGDLQIEISGPEKSYQVFSSIVNKETFILNNQQVEKTTIHCHFKPTVIGIYLISIYWKDKMVHKSPFKVILLLNNINLGVFV